MSQNPIIIVDDQNKDIEYLCPVNKQTVAGTYINNTWTSILSPACSSNGWFRYTFFGTRIQVAATTSNPNLTYSVTIDDGPRTDHTGDGFYESPVLSDGRHTITYFAPHGASSLSTVLDYLAVTSGRTTPVNGRTMIVDDMDNAVIYGGSWSTESPIDLDFDFTTSLYKSTTHWSRSIGDTIEYHFIGDSIAVYGIVANMASSPRDNISMSYILDGVPTQQGIPNLTLEGLPKAALFHSPNLTAGEHTLVINVSDITPPQALGFDFFLYNSTMPDPPTAASASASSATQARVGGIVGGVFGVLIFLGILFVLLFQLSKKRKFGVDRWFPVWKLKTAIDQYRLSKVKSRLGP